MVSVTLALVCLLPDRVDAQTPADGWSGQLQCLIASRGVGYEDDQTHTWVLSGAPGVRNDFRDYPATWTVSGEGRRAPAAARATAPGAGESWTYGGSNAGASITLSVPVGTGTLRIAGGQRAVTATNGIKGTTTSSAFTSNISEWRFQYIDVVNGAARTTLSDSRTQSRSDLAGWRPPPGTTVTETCSWKLTRNASSSIGGAGAKSSAAGAGAAGAGAARGAVIPEGAAPAGGAAGAAASNAAANVAGGAATSTTSIGGAAGSGASGSTAGAAKTGDAAGAAPAGGGVAGASSATAKPSGGGAAAATGTTAGSAANNPTAAGSSTATLSSDVMRPYTAIGRTPTPGTGVVVATLVDDAGAPLVGVSMADIRLVDATSLPVGVGPYMFGSTGDIVDSNTLRATASFNGRSRVAFLDVPAGTLTLTVMYSRDGKVVTRSARVITKAGAITAVQP